jgi:HEAT repeat protein
MTRFYCPGCWKDFEKDFIRCPFCGLNIHVFWSSRDHVEKLILALRHPEPSTPIRAAWLLGKTKDPRAVAALIDLLKTTRDIYIARAAVEALGETGAPDAELFLENITTHPVTMIRKEVERILGKEGRSNAVNES